MDEDPGKVNILIRTAGLNDVTAIMELAGQLGYPTMPGEIAVALRDLIALGDHQVFVAEVPGAGVVGWVHVLIAYRLVVKHGAELGGLVVRDGWRDQGIGKLLLEQAEAWALAQGFKSMRVNSNTLRQGVPGFYEHLGYERIKTQNVFYKTLA